MIYFYLVLQIFSFSLDAHSSAAASATPTTVSTPSDADTKQSAENFIPDEIQKAIIDPTLFSPQKVITWLDQNPQKHKNFFAASGFMNVPTSLTALLLSRIDAPHGPIMLPVLERLLSYEPALGMYRSSRTSPSLGTSTTHHAAVSLQTLEYSPDQKTRLIALLKKLTRLAIDQGASIEATEEDQRSYLSAAINHTIAGTLIQMNNLPRFDALTMSYIVVAQTILDEIGDIRKEKLLESQTAAESLTGALPRDLIDLTQQYITDIPKTRR